MLRAEALSYYPSTFHTLNGQTILTKLGVSSGSELFDTLTVVNEKKWKKENSTLRIELDETLSCRKLAQQAKG